ncbi:MAG: thioesterase [Desulfobacterales bacterium]|nr:thioesterase [Desulfobacterales bacterium]
MEIITHQGVDPEFCGNPLEVREDYSRVALLTTQRMAVDAKGLVHGGFVFGLADYAAMIAVNHPNVVLGSAEVKFIKPVSVGERVVAEARVDFIEGKKSKVYVSVARNDESVFEGVFICFNLDKHVLD